MARLQQVYLGHQSHLMASALSATQILGAPVCLHFFSVSGIKYPDKSNLGERAYFVSELQVIVPVIRDVIVGGAWRR